MFLRIFIFLFVCCISFELNAQAPAPPKPPAPPAVPGFPWPWKKKEKPSKYEVIIPPSKTVVAFTTDTAAIAYFVPGLELTGFADVEDTSYYFKHQPKGDTFCIYYDSSRTQLAMKKIMVKGFRYNDTNWYRNGALQKVQTNIDELPWNYHNVDEWYTNGKKKSELRYTQDSCTYYLWDANGVLKMCKRMANKSAWQTALWTGEEIHWEDRNGNKPSRGKFRSRKIVYAADSIVDSIFYYNGQLSRLTVSIPDSTMSNGMREHYRISYYSNGRWMHSPLYPDKGRQPVKYYYVTGKLKSKGEWESGNVGRHYEYYESGKLKSEGEYTMTSSLVPHTKYRQYFQVKSGTWVYYDETGKTIRKELYDGLTVIVVTIDKEGKEAKGDKQEVIPERILL